MITDNSQMPVDLLIEECKKYVKMAKDENLTTERCRELIEIAETLYKQADVYLAATNEIQISMRHYVKTSLRWKIYRWLFGVPYVTVKSTTINRAGQRHEMSAFSMNLEADTLTYFLNATKKERAEHN